MAAPPSGQRPPPRLKLVLSAVAAAGLITAIGLAIRHSQIQRQQQQQAAAALAAPIRTVTALGRLAPLSEVRTIAPPSGGSFGGQVRIRELLVEEGDAVHKGQLLAVLDNQPRLQAAVLEAEAQAKLAEAKLQIVGADQSSQASSELAQVERLRAELRVASAEEVRYHALYGKGVVSASDFDAKRLKRDALAAELRDQQAQLARKLSRSPAAQGGNSLDVTAAQRELQRANASLQRAQAERDDSLVRSPIDGQVLSVLGRPGEAASGSGLFELGETKRMQVVAEVYQSDIGRVQLGQPVRITSPALAEPLEGRVLRIGAIVKRQAIVNTDPSANIDTRVVEVRAPLNPASSARAAALSNLQVTVVIGP